MTRTEFDIDLSHGVDGENQLVSLLGRDATIEVKRDTLAHITGKVFVELLCKNRQSGLNATTAGWWAFVLDDSLGRMSRIILIPTARLKTLVALTTERVYGGDEKRAYGALVPVTELGRPL